MIQIGWMKTLDNITLLTTIKIHPWKFTDVDNQVYFSAIILKNIKNNQHLFSVDAIYMTNLTIKYAIYKIMVQLIPLVIK